MTTEHH